MLDKISAAIGLIAAMGGLPASANARTSSLAEADNKTVAIEQLIQSEMAERGIPGLQLTVVQHGKIIFTGAYGQANIETSTRVTKQTVFPINSISKAVAGVAAMQLVEAGKLDLDAPIRTYLEALPESWSGITVRQILNHMSGLPEISDDNLRLLDGAEPEAAWAKVQALPLKLSPGTKFDYTQTNYVVMGKIVEKLTGKSYADFVRDRQFDAVGMERTRFADVTGATTKPQEVQLYTHLTLKVDGMKTVGVERSKLPFARDEPWTEILFPAGGVRTTSTDLAKWVIALQKQKLVNKDSLEQLWKPQPQKDGTYRGFSSTINGYGLGWPSARRADHPAITPVGGARAAIFIYPEDDLSIVVLTNLMGASPEKFVDRIASISVPGFSVEK
ncbi:beta-lactamase family protein [Sphingomonas sp. QA11]|uniref:serine hydrolase domain-containing protein n=1 Tax=Sphingomonas sp. QA11 TaxID=2950605 RepID=UPI00234B845B|nr:serine hydrolase domain-containing protein [Sphingomonas sp. QA11]WCM26561.1 beta-lactamase family protein [Sphingomonas sp. QA11]